MGPTLVFIDVIPNDVASRERLTHGIDALRAEDDTLDARWHRERECLVLGGTGFDHLERLIERLAREFGVQAWVGTPAIAYKETVTRSAEGSGRFIRQTEGRGQFGEVVLRLHPGEPGSGYELDDSRLSGMIPDRFVPAIDRGVKEALASGVDAGYPIVDVRIELTGGSYHETDSSEPAFRAAAAMAVVEAARRAERTLLEPVMIVDVSVPSRQAGGALVNIVSRRGVVQSNATQGDTVRIVAHMPLAELLGFENGLPSSTVAHGRCTIQFLGYRPAPRPPDDGDDTSPVGAPRRPAPRRRTKSAEVPEPDEPYGA